MADHTMQPSKSEHHHMQEPGAQDIFETLGLPVIDKYDSDYRFEWVLVTPDVAKKLLGINYDKQRNIQPARVDMYSRDMTNGNWNSQASGTIQISSDGKVVDGQHRLLAVIKSGATLPMKVEFGGGSADGLFDYIDNTMMRTAGQLIKTKNSNAVAALSKSILCIERGSTITSALKGSYKYYKEDGKTVSVTPTRIEIVDYARSNASLLEEITTQARKVNSAVGANPMTIGLAIWCIHELHDACMLNEYIGDFLEVSPMNRTIGFIQGSILRKVSQARQQRVSVDKNWMFGVFAYGYDSFVDGKTVKSTAQWDRTLRLYSAAMQERYQQKGDMNNADRH